MQALVTGQLPKDHDYLITLLKWTQAWNIILKGKCARCYIYPILLRALLKSVGENELYKGNIKV